MNQSVGILMNRTKPPFDNEDVRQALALTLDRKSFIDILGQGQGDLGGATAAAAGRRLGIAGRTADDAARLWRRRAAEPREGSRTDEKGRVRSRQPSVKIKLSTRNIPVYRDPSAILLDQVKEIWIDGELELVETANWVPNLIRKNFTLALNVLGNAVDEPDVSSTRTMSAHRSATIPGTTTPSSTAG